MIHDQMPVSHYMLNPDAINMPKMNMRGTSESNKLFAALKENFGEIVTLIENIADEIRGISNSMRTVSGDTERITASVEDLSKNSQSISGEMQSVSAATEEQTASAQDIAQASDSLAGLAQELQAAIRVFQL